MNSSKQKRVTIFGHTGFVGSRAAPFFQELGYDVLLPERGEIPKGDLGKVLYCIGLTASFRQYPFEAVEAHVCLLKKILSECDFTAFCYLSSTRVYMRSQIELVNEDAEINVCASDPSDLYNLSKLMGESLCHACDKAEVSVARLSNVFGHGMSSDNFVGSLLDSARRDGEVTIGQAYDSAKDYLDVDDVVKALSLILEKGRGRVYNVASGCNVSHKQISDCLNELGVSVHYAPNAAPICFPRIDIGRVQAELSFSPTAGILDFIRKELKGEIS